MELYFHASLGGEQALVLLNLLFLLMTSIGMILQWNSITQGLYLPHGVTLQYLNEFNFLVCALELSLNIPVL